MHPSVDLRNRIGVDSQRRVGYTTCDVIHVSLFIWCGPFLKFQINFFLFYDLMLLPYEIALERCVSQIFPMSRSGARAFSIRQSHFEGPKPFSDYSKTTDRILMCYTPLERAHSGGAYAYGQNDSSSYSFRVTSV